MTNEQPSRAEGRGKTVYTLEREKAPWNPGGKEDVTSSNIIRYEFVTSAA